MTVVSDLNLDPPPGFRGLDPDLAIQRYQRNLPHWRQPGATYAVTFRLADSIPQAKLQYLERLRQQWTSQTKGLPSESEREEFGILILAHIQRWLDCGFGECLLADRRFAMIVHDALLHFHEQRYSLGCFVVMPNHCHAVIRPFKGFDLEKLLGQFKGYSAFEINRIRCTKGSVWQQECYDRIIRDEDHLYQAIQYVGHNPRIAGLVPAAWCRWINPNWESCGWHFREI